MMAALALVLAASDCASCHEEAHVEWQRSRHATAAQNPLYLASFEKHGRKQWCVGCHAPKTESAVGCTSCHLPEAGHQAKVDSRTCAKCHDFDVPKQFGVGEGPMQDTYDEWHASTAAREGKACASCHDHAARSGHDAKVLSEALRVKVRRKDGEIVATISAPGAGHAVPTGDPFRRLMLSAGSAQTRVVVPADGSVELKLGRGRATTWQLTYLHAEAEVKQHEHALHVMGGTIE
jgi:hypothetical protein